jgi:hypothetical protein
MNIVDGRATEMQRCLRHANIVPSVLVALPRIITDSQF